MRRSASRVLRRALGASVFRFLAIGSSHRNGWKHRGHGENWDRNAPVPIFSQRQAWLDVFHSWLMMRLPLRMEEIRVQRYRADLETLEHRSGSKKYTNTFVSTAFMQFVPREMVFARVYGTFPDTLP